MVGNTLPAINDITVPELIAVVEDTARFCPTIKVYPQYTQSAVLKAFVMCTLLTMLHTAVSLLSIATVLDIKVLSTELTTLDTAVSLLSSAPFA